jgi:hypothetical protein
MPTPPNRCAQHQQRKSLGFGWVTLNQASKPVPMNPVAPGDREEARMGDPLSPFGLIQMNDFLRNAP